MKLIPVTLPDGALACDCCGAPMTMLAAEAEFRCEACGQRHCFLAHHMPNTRYHTSLKLARMYPSHMGEASAIRREATQWFVRQLRFTAEAEYRLGVITLAQRDETLADVQRQWDEWDQAHQPRLRRWWQRLTGRSAAKRRK